MNIIWIIFIILGRTCFKYHFFYTMGLTILSPVQSGELHMVCRYCRHGFSKNRYLHSILISRIFVIILKVFISFMNIFAFFPAYMLVDIKKAKRLNWIMTMWRFVMRIIFRGHKNIMLPFNRDTTCNKLQYELQS